MKDLRSDKAFEFVRLVHWPSLTLGHSSRTLGPFAAQCILARTTVEAKEMHFRGAR